MDGDVGEKEEEWDLAQDSANDVECLQLNEFIALKTQILFEARNVCIIFKILVKENCNKNRIMAGGILRLD
jgi:hypothetical protein